MSIGARISELRKNKKLSQYQLAKLMNISRQAVSKWETDQSDPDTLNMIRLADILEVDLEYLASGRKSIASPSPAPVITVERVLEKPVEIVKTVEVIKEIPVDKIHEVIVEKPVIRKVLRTKYVRNPVEYLLMLMIGLLVGFFIGLLIP